METLVSEMYEDFNMSEACSKFYALAGNDNYEAQDEMLYCKYRKHASICKKAANACLIFLKNKKLLDLLLEFRNFELYENINLLKLQFIELNKSCK